MQKPAEDRPEGVIAQLFQVHHAGLAKQANQTLIGVGVPRDDPGQLRGDSFKEGQLHQKAAGGFFHPAKDRFFIIIENFLADGVGGGCGKGLAPLKVLGQQFQRQRIAIGLLMNGGQLTGGEINPMGLQKLVRGAPIQQKILRRQNPQNPRRLERQKPPGQRAPAQQQDPVAAAAPQQSAERLLSAFVLQLLQVVQDQGIPLFFQAGQREARLPGRQGHGAARPGQRPGGAAFAESAGRAEKHRPAAVGQLLVFFF